MPDKRRPLLKIVEEHFIKWVVGLFLAGICSFTIFYFSTTYTLAQNTQNIENVSNKLDTIKEIPVLNSSKIINIERLIRHMEEDSNELQADFKEFQKQYNDDRKQIIEILIDIKRNQ